jgi:hypothetical protein
MALSRDVRRTRGAVLGIGNTGMEYAALLTASLGLVTGIMFRLRVLLMLVAALPVAATMVAVKSGYGFLGTALTILVAQTILQASYFLGLAVMAMTSSVGREQRRSSDYALRPGSATGGRRGPF